MRLKTQMKIINVCLFFFMSVVSWGLQASTTLNTFSDWSVVRNGSNYYISTTTEKTNSQYAPRLFSNGSKLTFLIYSNDKCPTPSKSINHKIESTDLLINDFNFLVDMKNVCNSDSLINRMFIIKNNERNKIHNMLTRARSVRFYVPETKINATFSALGYTAASFKLAELVQLESKPTLAIQSKSTTNILQNTLIIVPFAIVILWLFFMERKGQSKPVQSQKEIASDTEQIATVPNQRPFGFGNFLIALLGFIVIFTILNNLNISYWVHEIVNPTNVKSTSSALIAGLISTVITYFPSIFVFRKIRRFRKSKTN